MLAQFAVLAAALVLCALLFRRKMNTAANRLAAVSGVALLLGLASAWDWVDCGRSLPLLSVSLWLLLCVKYKDGAPGAAGFPFWALLDTAPVRPNRPLSLTLSPLGGAREPAHRMGAVSRYTLPLLWSIFGLALLAKLGLYSRIWHYGFALAMPAFVGAIYLVLWVLPGMLQKYGVNGRLWRGAVGLLLLTIFGSLFAQSELIYRKKTEVVGRAGDRILAFNGKTDAVGPFMAQALSWMETNAPPAATLAVLPEGVMVNYLSRRSNPTRFPVWAPPELLAFGQSNMVADFESHAPDYVMLIQRDDAEYGVKYFGQEAEFGLELMGWIRRNYREEMLIGAEPLRNSAFGISILRREAVGK
jgi:hypothetical protein